MKHLYCLLLAGLVASSAWAQTDFSGKWVISENRIDWGMAPHWILPAGFNIKQDTSQITIERRLLDQQMVEHPYTAVLNFDGSVTQTPTLSNGTRKESMKWSDDKKTFVITGSSVGSDGTPGPAVTETWSLLNGGKTLLDERHVQQPNGMTYTSKAYYDRN